jgi:hypothetical protein
MTYTGDWVNGKMHGYCRITLPSEESYLVSMQITFGTAMGPISGGTAVAMQAYGEMTSAMDVESLLGQMATCMKGIGETTSVTAKESTSGLMEEATQAHG